MRRDPELQRFYRRKLVQKGLGKARVAVASKLGIRLWIMLRDEIDYQEFCRRGQKEQRGGACAAVLEVGNGANRHGRLIRRPALDSQGVRIPHQDLPGSKRCLVGSTEVMKEHGAERVGGHG